MSVLIFCKGTEEGPLGSEKVILFKNMFFMGQKKKKTLNLYTIKNIKKVVFIILVICWISTFMEWRAQWCTILNKPFSHAREPLYSNSTVIAWCLQSTSAQNIHFWLTVIHSMSQYFTAFNFHDVFFIWNYCLGIVVHSGTIRAFKF